MNSLEKKIRAQEWSLDEKRQKAEQLENLARNFRRQVERLEREIEVAREKVMVEPLRAAELHGQISDALLRRGKLRQSLKMLEGELARTLQEVEEVRREVRRFDLIKSRKNGAAKTA
jgi:chromosome segregation ATPase